jgi:hypothetical protein
MICVFGTDAHDTAVFYLGQNQTIRVGRDPDNKSVNEDFSPV